MRLVLVAGIAAAAMGGAVLAQEQGAFRSSTDLVSVYATVVDKNGQFVRGLTRDDFIVLDAGKPQRIVGFSDEAQPVSVSVILDTSGSMSSALPHVFNAARVLLDQLRPDDRAMLSSLIYQGPPFSADKSRLRTSLDLLPPDPGSPIFGALDRSLTTLIPELNRPVIVIYTDGKNAELPTRTQGRRPTAKPSTAESVQTRAEQAGVMVYAVGFEGVKLTTVMKTLAVRTGGRATELKSTDDLGATLAAIADELHQQYLLGFVPSVFDGRTHPIEVRLKSAEYVVRARQSYIAAKRP